MTNLSRDICFKLREARKAKGLNQSALARMAGCRQSAVSMFESGMVTKISGETVKKIAEILDVSLENDGEDKSETVQGGKMFPRSLVVHGYCPNCDCPSNVPYVVNGNLFYRADRNIASPGGGTRCTQCGEVLETKCPSCGAPLNDGACCAECGAAYVTPIVPEGADLEEFACKRRSEIAEFRAI